jgi:hypothetical protein
MMGAEDVLQRTRLPAPTRSNAEADVLRKQGGGDVDGQERHVLARHLTPARVRDVCRIVQQPLDVERHAPHVELANAAHAPPPWPENMRPPGGIAHVLISADIDGDPAVDYRDEVGVRDSVQNGSGPRSINARKNEVVVERLRQTFGLADAVWESADRRGDGRGVSVRLAPRNVDLESAQFGVTTASADHAVQVVKLHKIEVHNAEVPKAGSRQPDGNVQPDGTRTDD